MVVWLGPLGRNEKWSNLASILQVEPAVYLDGLDMRGWEEREVRTPALVAQAPG